MQNEQEYKWVEKVIKGKTWKAKRECEYKNCSGHRQTGRTLEEYQSGILKSKKRCWNRKRKTNNSGGERKD